MANRFLRAMEKCKISAMNGRLAAPKPAFLRALKKGDKQAALAYYGEIEKIVTECLDDLSLLLHRTRKKYEKMLAKYKQELNARGWLAE